MKRKTTRVQIELPQRYMKKLRELKRVVGAMSYAEVIRRAIDQLENEYQNRELL